MTMLIILAALAGYALGIFPAAVRIARWSADRGHCHHEGRFGGRDSYDNASRSWCDKFHRHECWRIDDGAQVRPADLKFAPAALAWPALLLGLLVISRANARPSTGDLQRQIAHLERELGMETRDA